MEESDKTINSINIAMPTPKQMAVLRKLWQLTMKSIRDAFSPKD